MIKYLFIAIVLAAPVLDAQFLRRHDVPTDVLLSRTERQGLFAYANNPAGAALDVERNYFSVTPEYGSADQAYRRFYDPATVEYGAMNTEMGRVLGEAGTFFGTASFRHEQRNRVFGSLRSDPYQGDPFFASDTFTGNFRYNGPRVGFAYAFDAGSDVLIGAEASYRILDGLKDTFTRAHSVERDFSVGAGVAYSLADASLCGVSARWFDEQEKIESKSEDLLDVEVFSYRGEYLATRRRGSVIEETFRTKGFELSGEAAACPIPGMKILAQATLRDKALTGLHPTSDLKEFEDGYAHHRSWGADAVARYALSQTVMPFVRVSWERNTMWAKNSERNLLLWEWTVQNTAAAAGAIVSIGADSYIRLEGELTTGTLDSTKYISGTMTAYSPVCSGVKAELRLPVSEALSCSGSLGYGGADRDPVAGGTDLRTFNGAASVAYRISDAVALSARYAYRHLEASMAGAVKTAAAQSFSVSIQLVQE